ncbi:MysB family protein [Serratia sp. AKBS12]|uniref:MysB family protein n=1 Tax=Serratia sp. AKBS12 TaxID=2974597 RepID=UPI002166B28A|nr:MysB family protein [Serratia sp. AKBS12]MCS3409076.1 MysB family protein [Serratia sp. AKBS12]
MSLYATLEEAIDAAREEFIESAEGGNDEEPPVPQQFNLQKYVMLDGDIMWQAEFFEEEGESVECLTLRSGAAAQAIFDGDYDDVEINEEWLGENTLYEWEEGDFQLDPPLDTEEGETAADEWDER